MPRQAAATCSVKNAEDINGCLAERGKVTCFDSDTGACRIYRSCDDDLYDHCFLATACAKHVGLPDDCFELEALRGLPDGVLAKNPERMADIERYDVEAPALVRRIAAHPDRDRELSRVYARYILPSALFARFSSIPNLLRDGPRSAAAVRRLTPATCKRPNRGSPRKSLLSVAQILHRVDQPCAVETPVTRA